jgi:hypothetical protein
LLQATHRRSCAQKIPPAAPRRFLRADLGEASFILHGWLQSGNTRSDSGVVEFLKEALAKRESRKWIRVVRADSGFFAQELLHYP